MTRRPRRPWLLGLVLFLCAAVLAAGAGVVLGSRGQPPAAAQPGGTAAPSASLPGESQTQADLITMQSGLNSGSVSQQAALLAPPLKFASGSGPVVPPGKTITIQPGTLHSSGQSGTVQARLSDGTAVTLGLHSTGGHWRLYDAQAGSVQTRAATTGQPVTAQLLSAIDRINYVPALDEIGQRTPVIFIHGYGGHGSDWGSTSTYGKPGDPNYGQPDHPTSMLYQVNQVPGTYVLSFNYDTGGPESANTKWVDNAASGPAFTRYLNQVAAVSKKAHGPGKVIVVAFSMGGLVTRYAAANGAADAIAMVTTIGTPNRGSFMGDVISFACFANSALGQGRWQAAPRPLRAVVGSQRHVGLQLQDQPAADAAVFHLHRARHRRRPAPGLEDAERHSRRPRWAEMESCPCGRRWPSAAGRTTPSIRS